MAPPIGEAGPDEANKIGTTRGRGRWDMPQVKSARESAGRTVNQKVLAAAVAQPFSVTLLYMPHEIAILPFYLGINPPLT